MTPPVLIRGIGGLTAAAFAGLLSVAVLLFALLHPRMGLSIIAMFSGMPIYMAGLGAGNLAAFLSVAVAIVCFLVTLPSNYAVLYALIFGLPALSFVALSLRYRVDGQGAKVWYSEGRIFAAITLYPCLIFLIAAAAGSSHPGGLLALTTENLHSHAAQFAATFPEKSIDDFHRFIEASSPILPAFISYLWIMMTVISAAGAQNILVKCGWNLREGFALKKLYLPSQLIYAVAMTGLFGAFANAPYDYIGRNLSLILGLPFFFVGLAVAHGFFNSFRTWIKYLAYFVFYLALLMAPVIALLLACLGVVDQWIDFRRRYTTKTTV